VGHCHSDTKTGRRRSFNIGRQTGGYITSWPTAGNLATIQLRHLLSFTSGLNEEHFCQNNPNADFEDCVNKIAGENSSAPAPGTEFYYDSSHLQVAGLMAIKASGASSWKAVFDQFKTDTGLFTGSDYDLPSLQNPRLAGGMHWTANQYMDFLEALHNNDILSPALTEAMHSNQVGNAAIVFSPALNAISQDFRYGFGNWIECAANPYNCTSVTRVSSPGAYGAYPFVDYEYHYFGIIARQGALATFDQGYAIYDAVKPLLQDWATEANL